MKFQTSLPRPAKVCDVNFPTEGSEEMRKLNLKYMTGWRLNRSYPSKCRVSPRFWTASELTFISLK